MSRSSSDYPVRPVRLIEPFGRGGGLEVLAAPVAAKLSEIWGQPMTVENHPGGGATAAPALVAIAPPDGYVLLVNTGAHVYSAAAVGDLPYDPLRDFVAVAPLTRQAYVLVAGKDARIGSVAELIAAARAKPGQLRFGSAGAGTSTHLVTEQLHLAAGITAAHTLMPGDDIAETVARTARGETDYVTSPISIAAPHMENGGLVALGVSSARRSPLLPGVPTIEEAGVAGFDFPIWYGIWAPAATPSEVVETLAADVAAALSTPDLSEWFANHGAEPMRMTQPEFAAFVRSESRRAARILEHAGTDPPRPVG